jgi:hypothetical protein
LRVALCGPWAQKLRRSTRCKLIHPRVDIFEAVALEQKYRCGGAHRNLDASLLPRPAFNESQLKPLSSQLPGAPISCPEEAHLLPAN